MSVSAPTLVVAEGHALAATTFVRGGISYVAWVTAAAAGGTRLLWFRVHDGATGSEVQAKLAAPLNRFAMAARDDGNLLVVYDDGNREVPGLWRAVITPEGAVVLPPLRIGDGSAPTLLTLANARFGRMTLTYANRKKGSAYIRESKDYGKTFGGERPILNARVRDGVEVAAVPFGEKHLSLVQVGGDARPLVELGSATRTRPLAGLAIVGENRLAVSEAAANGAMLADNLRGNLATDGASVFVPTRVRVGTNDGVSEVALYDVSGATPALLASSATPTLGSPGAEIGRVELGPNVLTQREVRALPALGVVAQVATAGGYLYAASYREDVTDGSLCALRLSDGAANRVQGGLHFHGVAVATPPGGATADTVIATCRMVGSQNYLGIGKLGADPMNPTWLLGDHALPARADNLTLAVTSASEGTVYAALADRVNIYRVSGLSRPVRLTNTFLCLTGGRVMHMVLAPNGNLVCAMGEGGLSVFTPDGEVVSHLLPSGLPADYWRRGAAYSQGAYVRPLPTSGYYGQGRRFRCTVAGTSGAVEPSWAPQGNITDAGATWVEDGPVAAVVTAVAVDGAARRIYAAATLGGPSGTGGRVYTFDARGLV